MFGRHFGLGVFSGVIESSLPVGCMVSMELIKSVMSLAAFRVLNETRLLDKGPITVN